MNPLAEKGECVVVGRVWRRTEEEKKDRGARARRPPGSPRRSGPGPRPPPSGPRRGAPAPATTQAAAQAAARAAAPARPLARPGQTGGRCQRGPPSRPGCRAYRGSGGRRAGSGAGDGPAAGPAVPAGRIRETRPWTPPAEPVVQPGWGAPAGADAPNGANARAVPPAPVTSSSLGGPPRLTAQPVPVADQGPPPGAARTGPAGRSGRCPGPGRPGPRCPGAAAAARNARPAWSAGVPPVGPAARPAPAEHSEPPRLPQPSRSSEAG